MGPVMFPFVLGPQGGVVVAVTQADAAVISAICIAIPATIAACVGAYNARQAAKQMKPNGGSSMRDVADETRRIVGDLVGEVREIREDVRSIRDDQRSDHARITRLENP